MNTSTKLILVVCEPVRRAISHFAMSVERNKLPNTTFEKHVFKKQRGVRKFRNGDNLKIRPWQEVTAFQQFLELKPYIKQEDFVYNSTKGFYCYRKGAEKRERCLSPSKGRKHPEINKDDREILTKYFKPYNELFFKQSNRVFSW